MSFPRLGLIAEVARPDACAPLLRALADRCHVVAWHPGLRVDAIFVLSACAPRAAEAVHAVDGRAALWSSASDPESTELRAKVAVTVGLVDGDIRVPDPGIDLRHYRALAPFLRERWRNRFALTVPVEMPSALAWRQQRTFLALCPAVVATGPVALEALAFGTPLVTDHDTCEQLGGTDALDLVVAGTAEERLDLATALGRDHRRAAAIGRAGRRLAERRHDLSPAASELARALGFPRRGDLVGAHLADLPTPPLARPFTRAAARMGELSVA